MNLNGSGNKITEVISPSLWPSQRASQAVRKPYVSWEGSDVCAWMWQEMLSEQSWMLQKIGVNCAIQSEEQQINPEGFCSAFLGALSGKSCGKHQGVNSQHLWELIPQTSPVEYHKWKQWVLWLLLVYHCTATNATWILSLKVRLLFGFFLSSSIRVFLSLLAQQEDSSIFIS